MDSSELTDSSDSELEEDSQPLLMGLSGPSGKEGECSTSSGSGVTEEAQDQQQSAYSSDDKSSPPSSEEQAKVTETPPEDQQCSPPEEQQVQGHQEGDTPVVNQDNENEVCWYSVLFSNLVPP